MKQTALISTLALVFSIAAAHADTASLKDNMKHIRALVKGITAVVSDPSKNKQSAADAASIANLFMTAEGQVPDSISELPANEQAAALDDYKSMIQHEVDYALSLEKAFETGDNAKAASILQQMDDLKHDGHAKYAD